MILLEFGTPCRVVSGIILMIITDANKPDKERLTKKWIANKTQNLHLCKISIMTIVRPTKQKKIIQNSVVFLFKVKFHNVWHSVTSYGY